MNVEISVPLEAVFPNPWQPRESENQEHIKSLALSIAQDGLLQKPVGRVVDVIKNRISIPQKADFLKESTGLLEGMIEKGDFAIQLAFGHSRLAAFEWLRDVQPHSNIDGDWTSIPVVLQEISDEDMFRLAITENLQRNDLNPIEEAAAMERYRSDFGKTSEEIGKLFGKSDSAVRNKIRLLKLPEVVKDLLRAGTITEGQARALVNLYEIPEDLRLAAEDSDNLKPSDILNVAASGVSPSAITQLVNDFSSLVMPAEVKQLSFITPEPVPSEESIENSQETETEDYQVEEEAPESMDSETEPESVSVETLPEKQILPMSPAQDIQEVEPKKAAVNPVKKIETKPEPDPEPEVSEAVTWENSTITLTLTYWPDDGVSDGRMVAIGARLNQDAPKMALVRAGSINLPEVLESMMNQLQESFGMVTE